MAGTVRVLKASGTYPPTTYAGGLRIDADDVTVQRPVVHGGGGVNYGIQIGRRVNGAYYENARLVSGKVDNAIKKGVYGANFAAIGTLTDPFVVSECGQDGFFISGSHTHIERAHVHHLGKAAYSSPTQPPHADGAQITAGDDHYIGKTFFELPHQHALGYDSNSCIYIESDFGPIGHVVIEEAILDGGLYSLFIVEGNYGPPDAVELVNCEFRRCWNASINWDLDNLPPWLVLTNCRGMTNDQRL